ncbi:MAG: family 16 glycosylhydrolase [Bacteroidota bacterium]
MKVASRFYPLLHFILLITLSTTGFAQYEPGRKAQGAGDLIWSDEFDGTGIPDAAKWERQEYNRRNNENGPDGWWSNEDSYLDGNGNLVIRVRKIDNKNDDADTCDFSVGMVRSKGRFAQLYGKFEIRCKLPTQPGWWVAFWMMQGDVGSVENGGVDGTEVDIMEGFGWTDQIQHAFHWDGYGEAHQSIGHKLKPAGIREGFHTYSMEWYPEMYVFFVDGEETWRSEGGGVCNQAGYIKVTGEISTEEWAINNWWANNPADATYPDSFVVDYVRVYEIGEYQFPASVSSTVPTGLVHVYPNPAVGQISVQWDSELFIDLPMGTLKNTVGQTVSSFSYVENNARIPMDGLPQGIYFLTLNSDQRVVTERVVKL